MKSLGNRKAGAREGGPQYKEPWRLHQDSEEFCKTTQLRNQEGMRSKNEKAEAPQSKPSFLCFVFFGLVGFWVFLGGWFFGLVCFFLYFVVLE